MNLTNHTILITGGTSGIGWALARALKEKNNKLIVLGRNEAALTRAREAGFSTIKCDLGKQAEIEEAVVQLEQHYPELDVLINNAGVQYNYVFAEAVPSFEKIKAEIEVNLTGQIYLTQLLIPLLGSREKAYIVNTTSGLGAFPKPDGVVYSASKAGMRNFSKALRYALGGQRIKVMEFIPPVTATPMTAGRGATLTPDELVRSILPQMAREKALLTSPQVRLFLLLAVVFPRLVNKILSKEGRKVDPSDLPAQQAHVQ